LPNTHNAIDKELIVCLWYIVPNTSIQNVFVDVNVYDINLDPLTE